MHSSWLESYSRSTGSDKAGLQLELWTPEPITGETEIAFCWEMLFDKLVTSPMENELRYLPAHYSSIGNRHVQSEILFEEMDFSFDELRRCLSCRLRGELGNSRCLLAMLPLPRLFTPTAFPRAHRDKADSNEAWCLAHRCWSYYEVSIGEAAPRLYGYDEPCIAVGLATDDISADALLTQMPGWNQQSWALHGDDGKIFHNRQQGKAFRPVARVSLDALKGCGIPPHIDTQPTIAPTFGAGDVVGCGTIQMVESWLGIFFTLNGRMLGVAFLMESSPNLKLYPCIGVDAPWSVTINFGQRPFLLDLGPDHA